MRVFVPLAKDQKEAERVYQSIKKTVEAKMGRLISTRYYAVYYRHRGKDVRVRVGDSDPLTGELVLAILRTERLSGDFYICTSQSATRGPVIVSGAQRTIEFERG
jgi:hypothetical protein